MAAMLQSYTELTDGDEVDDDAEGPIAHEGVEL